jgi:hypothetical protein
MRGMGSSYFAMLRIWTVDFRLRLHGHVQDRYRSHADVLPQALQASLVEDVSQQTVLISPAPRYLHIRIC